MGGLRWSPQKGRILRLAGPNLNWRLEAKGGNAQAAGLVNQQQGEVTVKLCRCPGDGHHPRRLASPKGRVPCSQGRGVLYFLHVLGMGSDLPRHLQSQANLPSKRTSQLFMTG